VGRSLHRANGEPTKVYYVRSHRTTTAVSLCPQTPTTGREQASRRARRPSFVRPTLTRTPGAILIDLRNLYVGEPTKGTVAPHSSVYLCRTQSTKQTKTIGSPYRQRCARGGASWRVRRRMRWCGWHDVPGTGAGGPYGATEEGDDRHSFSLSPERSSPSLQQSLAQDTRRVRWANEKGLGKIGDRGALPRPLCFFTH